MLEGFFDRVECAATRGDLQSLITDLRDHYGISHIVYHWVNSDGEQWGVGTYDVAWAEHYVKSGYLRVDPVIQGCFQRFHPVEWKRLDWSSKAARALMTEAIEWGVGNQGYSIPLRGPKGQFALFTMNDSCSDETWQGFCDANVRDLLMIAHYFNHKALEFAMPDEEKVQKQLSPRETDALTFLALGYSRAQIAETLDISEHTLRVYVESARFKLGAINTTQAVARALSLGLIVV
ncbi:MAG: LuxR family transcriptional regulator [Paracoccaceae bacterium]|nr:LuxR family transcriptional regulator [Paracoccaceae bacterium]